MSLVLSSSVESAVKIIGPHKNGVDQDTNRTNTQSIYKLTNQLPLTNKNYWRHIIWHSQISHMNHLSIINLQPPPKARTNCKRASVESLMSANSFSSKNKPYTPIKRAKTIPAFATKIEPHNTTITASNRGKAVLIK